MKSIITVLCIVLVVGFTSTAFAVRAEKADICHNGSVYTGDTSDGAEYVPEAWEAGSFIINISGNAVTKHEANHGDSQKFTEGEEVITEVVVGEDGLITGFETQASCILNE